MLMLLSASVGLLKETWQRCHVVYLPWNLKPGCSWSWSKAGDRATWAGMFSADMRSPTSVSPACTSARCSAGSPAATSWRVRGQRVGGGFENCNWWYCISLQMTALQTFLVLTTTHAYLFLYIHSNICRMLILTVLLSLVFTVLAFLHMRAVQGILCLCFLLFNQSWLQLPVWCWTLLWTPASSDSTINRCLSPAAFVPSFSWLYLCARGIAVPTSMWKSSWDTLVECRVGQRSTSSASASILWKTDTILQEDGNEATEIHTDISQDLAHRDL